MGASSGVDIDRVHRFCPVKEKISAAGQPNFAPERFINFPFDIKPLKHRHFIPVEFDFKGVFATVSFIDFFAPLIGRVIIDEKAVEFLIDGGQ